MPYLRIIILLLHSDQGAACNDLNRRTVELREFRNRFG
jgi:hypothetical protein